MQNTTVARRLAHLLGALLIAMTSLVTMSSAASAQSLDECYSLGVPDEITATAADVHAASFVVCPEESGCVPPQVGIHPDCQDPTCDLGSVGIWPNCTPDCSFNGRAAAGGQPICDPCDAVNAAQGTVVCPEDPCEIGPLGQDADPRCECLDVGVNTQGLKPAPCAPTCLDLQDEVLEGFAFEGARPSGNVAGRNGVTIPDFRAQGREEPELPLCDPPVVVVEDPPAPSVTLTSTAKPTGGVVVGDTVTFTHNATNNGDTTLDDVVITNEVGTSGGTAEFSASGIGAGSAAVQAAALGTGTVIEVITSAAGVSLAPGATMVFTSTYVVKEGDLPGPLTSTAHISSGTASATSTTLVGLLSRPAIALELAPDAPSVEWNVDSPPTITWTYTVRNIGDVPVGALALTDDDGVVSLAGVGALAPGQSTTATSRYTLGPSDALAGAVRNSARVVGTIFDGRSVEGLAAATVDVTGTQASAPDPLPEPEAEVLGEVVDREEPAPVPVPAAEPVAAPETLPATGEHDAALGALAFLLTLFGLLMVVGISDRTVAASRRDT